MLVPHPPVPGASQRLLSQVPSQRLGGSVPPDPSPTCKKEEARDMGTPEQLSSSKTQQVIPGERRQGRSARALTPENQSIVTWRESRATAGPAPPPVLRYRRSQSKRALSRRVGRQSAKEGGGRPGAWGGGKVGGGWRLAGGEAGERGEGWGAPREEGSCGQAPPMRLFFFFLKELFAAV